MIARLWVTVGGVGLIPFAPGTWGSAVAIPLVWALHWMGGFMLVAWATAALFITGILAIRAYLHCRVEDPSEIVIEEVVGMMIALWPLSFMLEFTGVEARLFPWPGWVGAFVAFRFFDIVKPPPVSWFDRPGTWGIMLDDVVAGFFAAVIMFASAGVAHGWF